MDFNSQMVSHKQKKFLSKDSLIAFVFSACFTLYCEFWASMSAVERMEDVIAMYAKVSVQDILFFLCSFVLSFLVLRFWRNQGTKAADFVYKWRFVIGTVILLLLVAFNINGSSVHCWSQYFSTEHSGILLGTERAIRSDEWVVNTPMALSQAASGFHYFSPVIGAGADAFIVYGQPVKDIAIIFRPFQWGYLFLGADRGLSFFWNARLICLLLISFEIGMLILNRKRSLSLLFALMIGFSPFVQWWFAINGLVEMLVSGFSAVLLINMYLNSTSYINRALYAVAIAWMGCIFVLTFYPAWMVPIAYILLALLIWVLVQNKSVYRICGRDILVLLEIVVLMAIGLGYVFLKSKDTIHAVLNSVYPGKRVGSPPLPWMYLFLYPNGIFSSLKSDYGFSNVCELANVICFFPLGIVLFATNSIKRRKMDLLSLLLLGISVLMGIFCFVGMSEGVMTLTLFRFSTAGRTLPVFTFVQLMLLFRELAIARQENAIGMNYTVPTSMVITTMIIYGAHCMLDTYYTVEMMLIIGILTFSVSMISFGIGKYPELKNTLAICVAFVTLIGGILVNPVQAGTAELSDNEITKMVQPIVKQEPDGVWIVESSYPIINAIIPIGARTINCTNVYPNLERWYLLDKDKTHEDIYNRYAHIIIHISPEATHFDDSQTPDVFNLSLNPNDIKILDVNYILTTNELENMDFENGRFVRIGEAGAFKAYRVEYDKGGER